MSETIINIEKAEIAKLQLNPNDILVLKVNHHISKEVHQKLKEFMEMNFPGQKAIVLEPGLELEIVTGGD